MRRALRSLLVAQPGLGLACPCKAWWGLRIASSSLEEMFTRPGSALRMPGCSRIQRSARQTHLRPSQSHNMTAAWLHRLRKHVVGQTEQGSVALHLRKQIAVLHFT